MQRNTSMKVTQAPEGLQCVGRWRLHRNHIPQRDSAEHDGQRPLITATCASPTSPTCGTGRSGGPALVWEIKASFCSQEITFTFWMFKIKCITTVLKLGSCNTFPELKDLFWRCNKEQRIEWKWGKKKIPNKLLLFK